MSKSIKFMRSVERDVECFEAMPAVVVAARCEVDFTV